MLSSSIILDVDKISWYLIVPYNRLSLCSPYVAYSSFCLWLCGEITIENAYIDRQSIVRENYKADEQIGAYGR